MRVGGCLELFETSPTLHVIRGFPMSKDNATGGLPHKSASRSDILIVMRQSLPSPRLVRVRRGIEFELGPVLKPFLRRAVDWSRRVRDPAHSCDPAALSVRFRQQIVVRCVTHVGGPASS